MPLRFPVVYHCYFNCCRSAGLLLISISTLVFVTVTSSPRTYWYDLSEAFIVYCMSFSCLYTASYLYRCMYILCCLLPGVLNNSY